MKSKNILTYKMHICRPVLLISVTAVTISIISKTRDIVRKCINPHIYDMSFVKVNRYAPLKRTSRYTQILKSWKKEVVDHLVLSGNRLNEIRMSVDILKKSVSILAHLEEVSFFLRWSNLSATVRTLAVN